MNKKRIFLIICSLSLCLYAYTHLRFSFSSVEASEQPAQVEPSSMTAEEFWSENKEKEVAEKQRLENKDFKQNESINHHTKLVQLLKQARLCDFLNYAKKNGIGEKLKYKALSDSFEETPFPDLHIFLKKGVSETDDSQTQAVKSYLVAQKLYFFSERPPRERKDFNAGFSQEDQALLESIDKLTLSDGGNLFYSFLKAQIYHGYNNRSDQLMEPLFHEMMSASRYENPVFSLFKNLYHQAKDNVAQFYLVTKILNRSVATHHIAAASSVWFFGTLDIRSHISSLLYDSLKNNNVSAKAYGYEPGIYRAYRSMLPYEEYRDMSDYKEYEAGLSQPAYKLSDLKIKIGQRCDQEKVDELEAKLRAL